VSQALAREACCPVIVVPRGAERALEELLPTTGKRFAGRPGRSRSRPR
jgi:hypothetical protein